MDSPIEKWNLIIGNLALKQVSDAHICLQILGLYILGATCKNGINPRAVKNCHLIVSGAENNNIV